MSGLTKETIDTLYLICKNSFAQIYCVLLMDEIANLNHIKWNGYIMSYGLFNFRTEIENETVGEATERFVFMFFSMNPSRIIPVECFLI